MKRLLSLLLFCLSILISTAQVTPFEPQVDWDDPEFAQNQIQKNKIKSIRVSSFEIGKAHRRVQYKQGVSYHYDPAGQLTKQVETIKSQQDTTQVHQYLYSKQGRLRWETTEDKRWRRVYRTGYRFTGHGAPYQAKSYELLRNDERVLLTSRQYIYDQDSLVTSIRLLENRQVVRVHRFLYSSDQDRKPRVSREVIESGTGDLIKQVTYAYDAKGLITHVVMTEPNGHRSEYHYTYNDRQQPTRIDWLQGEQQIGLVLYEYNEQGLVTHMNQTLSPNTPQQRAMYKVFEYERYEADPSLLALGQKEAE